MKDEPKSFLFKEKWSVVFIYGKEVHDKHILDKDALFTINFAATKEIDRIQQEEKNKVQELQEENNLLKDEVNLLKAQLAEVLMRLNKLEN